MITNEPVSPRTRSNDGINKDLATTMNKDNEPTKPMLINLILGLIHEGSFSSTSDVKVRSMTTHFVIGIIVAAHNAIFVKKRCLGMLKITYSVFIAPSHKNMIRLVVIVLA